MTRHRKRGTHRDERAPEAQRVPAHPAHHVQPQKPHEAHRLPARPAPGRKISWRAAEFHYFEKDYLWYVWAVFTGVVLLAFALWQRNFFFAVFVVIATVLFVEFGKRRPRTLDYELNEKEVLIDGRMSIPYKSIESFHVRKRLGLLDEVVFKRATRVNPFIHLPIDEELAVRAREFLLEFLPEDEHEQTIVEIIAERIGF